MNIVFNKYIFIYLCLFYNLIKYFYEFQRNFINFYFINIFIKISNDILSMTYHNTNIFVDILILAFKFFYLKMGNQSNILNLNYDNTPKRSLIKRISPALPEIEKRLTCSRISQRSPTLLLVFPPNLSPDYYLFDRLVSRFG